MIGIELRICQIIADKALSKASPIPVSPGLFTILSLIQQNPGQKQITLAESVKLDRSSLVPIIDQCEKSGWVKRLPYPGDRRAHAIHLTRKGVATLEQLEYSVLLLEQRITEGLGVSNKNLLLSLLKDLQTTLSE
jgi:DNA-binding MarR family transcriptional regulator